MNNSLEQRSHDLQDRLDAIEQELAEIDASMTQLASQFSGTDGRDVMRQVSQLDAASTALKREKFVALNAQALVNKQMLDAKAAQAEQDRRALMAKAKQLADGICSANAAIDQILKQLVEAFERRASLFHDLGNTGLIDSAVINKLAGKGAATRAACHAQLHRYISLEKVAQTSLCTLGSTNSILIGIGKDLPPASNGGEAIQQPSGENGRHVASDGSNGSIPRHRRTEAIS
jgi:hypothetical protein